MVKALCHNNNFDFAGLFSPSVFNFPVLCTFLVQYVIDCRNKGLIQIVNLNLTSIFFSIEAAKENFFLSWMAIVHKVTFSVEPHSYFACRSHTVWTKSRQLSFLLKRFKRFPSKVLLPAFLKATHFSWDRRSTLSQSNPFNVLLC